MKNMYSVILAFLLGAIYRIGLVALDGKEYRSIKDVVGYRSTVATELSSLLEKEELTADEQKRHDDLEAELRKVDSEIDRLEKAEQLRARQRELETRTSQLPATPRYSPVGDRFSVGQRRDIARFSVPRLLSALVEGRNVDGVEAEMMQEGQSETRQSSIQIGRNAVMIPSFAVLGGDEQRDMTATGGTGLNQGGMTIQTNKLPLLDDLFNRLVLTQAGMTTYSGLVGNLDIPRLHKGSDPAHKAENANADETSPTTSQISLNPKRLPTFVDVSRQLFLQSQERNLDTTIRRHIIGQLAEIMQRQLINGAGGTVPRGILNTTGIGAVVASGANGSAPTWANIVELETKVAIQDADVGNLHYLTNTAVRGKLKTTPVVASTDSRMIWPESGMVNGYQPLITNGVPSNLVKGSSSATLSAIIFGNFIDLVMAQWSGIEFIVDEVTQAVPGLIRLHAAVYYDGAVQRPASFAAMKDAVTA